MYNVGLAYRALHGVRPDSYNSSPILQSPTPNDSMLRKIQHVADLKSIDLL